MLGALCVLRVLLMVAARAGEGTLTQLADVGLDPTQVQAVCITHHHGDHCFGLPALVQARHELQLERECASPSPPVSAVSVRYICTRMSATLHRARSPSHGGAGTLSHSLQRVRCFHFKFHF